MGWITPYDEWYRIDTVYISYLFNASNRKILNAMETTKYRPVMEQIRKRSQIC
jgi:hypothetical protein